MITIIILKMMIMIIIMIIIIIIQIIQIQRPAGGTSPPIESETIRRLGFSHV